MRSLLITSYFSPPLQSHPSLGHCHPACNSAQPLSLTPVYSQHRSQESFDYFSVQNPFTVPLPQSGSPPPARSQGPTSSNPRTTPHSAPDRTSLTVTFIVSILLVEEETGATNLENWWATALMMTQQFYSIRNSFVHAPKHMQGTG